MPYIGGGYGSGCTTRSCRADLTWCSLGIDAVVLVHGCFWHAHEGCTNFKRPSTRQAFWDAKFESNKTRDRRDIAQLEEMGWRVAVVWECATRRDLEPTLDCVYAWIVDGGRELEVPR